MPQRKRLRTKHVREAGDDTIVRCKICLKHLWMSNVGSCHVLQCIYCRDPIHAECLRPLVSDNECVRCPNCRRVSEVDDWECDLDVFDSDDVDCPTQPSVTFSTRKSRRCQAQA